ncbi:MAG: hypothetical protein RIE73_28605 [Coleofasciculus sp. C1-SOL-03]
MVLLQPTEILIPSSLDACKRFAGGVESLADYIMAISAAAVSVNAT